MNALIPIEQVNVDEVFAGDALDTLLAQIRQQATAEKPDVETPAGRKEIASLAHKVARSKTAIDAAGKERVAGIKEQAKGIDALRKKARDYLDALKAEVRAPLDEWEEETRRKIEAKKAEEGRFQSVQLLWGLLMDFLNGTVQLPESKVRQGTVSPG